MFEFSLSTALLIVAALIIIASIGTIVHNAIKKTDIQDSTSNPKVETKYKNQVQMISDKYNPLASARIG